MFKHVAIIAKEFRILTKILSREVLPVMEGINIRFELSRNSRREGELKQQLDTCEENIETMLTYARIYIQDVNECLNSLYLNQIKVDEIKEKYKKFVRSYDHSDALGNNSGGASASTESEQGVPHSMTVRAMGSVSVAAGAFGFGLVLAGVYSTALVVGGVSVAAAVGTGVMHRHNTATWEATQQEKQLVQEAAAKTLHEAAKCLHKYKKSAHKTTLLDILQQFAQRYDYCEVSYEAFNAQNKLAKKEWKKSTELSRETEKKVTEKKERAHNRGVAATTAQVAGAVGFGVFAVVAAVATGGAAAPVIAGVLGGAAGVGALGTGTYTYKKVQHYKKILNNLENVEESFTKMNDISHQCSIQIRNVHQQLKVVDKKKGDFGNHLKSKEDYDSFCSLLDEMLAEVRETKRVIKGEKLEPRIDEIIKELTN